MFGLNKNITIQVQCPFCDVEQKETFNILGSLRRITVCDVERGGCDTYFAVIAKKETLDKLGSVGTVYHAQTYRLVGTEPPVHFETREIDEEIHFYIRLFPYQKRRCSDPAKLKNITVGELKHLVGFDIPIEYVSRSTGTPDVRYSTKLNSKQWAGSSLPFNEGFVVMLELAEKGDK